MKAAPRTSSSSIGTRFETVPTTQAMPHPRGSSTSSSTASESLKQGSFALRAGRVKCSFLRRRQRQQQCQCRRGTGGGIVPASSLHEAAWQSRWQQPSQFVIRSCLRLHQTHTGTEVPGRGETRHANQTIGERHGTGVLGRGVPARPALYVEARGGSPPTPCAAHPEPFSYVEVDSREVVWWPVPRRAPIHARARPSRAVLRLGGCAALREDTVECV